MDLQVILASTVVAAVISMLTSVYNSRRTENLKYVTEERQKWREEIREIAQEIVVSSKDDIKLYLTKLKVRINANGNGKRHSYYEDSHIWKMIEKLTDSEDEEKFEREKELLVNYLSAMLKYDWERQKREVLGSATSKIKIFLSIVIIAAIFIDSKTIGIHEFIMSTLAILPIFSGVIDKLVYSTYKIKDYKKLSFVIAIVCITYFFIAGILIYDLKNLGLGIVAIIYANSCVVILDVIYTIKMKSDYEKNIRKIRKKWKKKYDR